MYCGSQQQDWCGILLLGSRRPATYLRGVRVGRHRRLTRWHESQVRFGVYGLHD